MDVEAGGDPSAATFTFHNEDHTIGNTSRSTMHLRNSLHLRVGAPQEGSVAQQSPEAGHACPVRFGAQEGPSLVMGHTHMPTPRYTPQLFSQTQSQTQTLYVHSGCATC